ncbi:hypothetical protein [Desulforhopalus sp. 52FAK]
MGMKLSKFKQGCFLTILLGLTSTSSAYDLCDGVDVPDFPYRIDEDTTITGYECKDNHMTSRYVMDLPASEIIRNDISGFKQSVREDRCHNLQYGLKLTMIFTDSNGTIATIDCD